MMSWISAKVILLILGSIGVWSVSGGQAWIGYYPVWS